MDRAKIEKGLRHPFMAYNSIKSIARGQYYKLKYKVLNKNVFIGKNFRVNSRLSIRGPGKVVIGDNVVVGASSQAVTPCTYHKNAQIIIGNNVFLNGTRFGCKRSIEIGDDCILADCRILDTDFHSINPEKRNDAGYIESAPVKIGNNVWISLGCLVLRGVTIGDNSTISAQSVVCNDVEKSSLYAGNPAVFIKKVYGEDK